MYKKNAIKMINVARIPSTTSIIFLVEILLLEPAKSNLLKLL